MYVEGEGEGRAVMWEHVQVTAKPLFADTAAADTAAAVDLHFTAHHTTAGWSPPVGACVGDGATHQGPGHGGERGEEEE